MTVLRDKAQSQQANTPQWWERDTRVYRICAIAEQWRIRPSDLLRWSQTERRLVECYLIAKGLKYEASSQHQSQKTEEQQFDTRLQQWAQQLAQQTPKR